MAVTKRICAMSPEEIKEFRSGAFFLGEALGKTFGPFGQNWALEKGDRVTNDGYTIAQELWLENELAQRGLVMARKAVMDSNTRVGDGSTTAGILVASILKACVEFLPKGTAIAGKLTSTELLSKLKEECKTVVEKLKEMSKPVESKEDLVKAVLVSSEDETLANLIGETQWVLGKDGVIIAEEVNAKESSIERVNGLRFDNGMAVPLMVTDQERQELVIDETKIILTNYEIHDLKALEPLLRTAYTSGARKVTVVARAFGIQALKDIEANIQTGFYIYPLNAPYTDQKQVMLDLQAVTGARYIDTEAEDLSSLMISDIGYAKRIVSKRFDTIVTGPEDEKAKERIAKRIEDMKEKRDGAESEFEKRSLTERLAQLESGFALLKIGSVSVTDRKRLKDKADDACNAARNILQEGTVPGAGKAFKDISDILPAGSVLKAALVTPYNQITTLAPTGWSIPEWVVDSTKVQRVILEICVSVAGNIATAIGVVTTKNEETRYMVEKKD